MHLWLVALVVGSASAGKNKKAPDACPGLPADQRPSVVVGELSAQTPLPETVAPALAGRLRTKLLTTGCFAIDLKEATGRYEVAAIFSEYADTSKPTAMYVNNETIVAHKAELGLILTLTDTQTDTVLVTEVLGTEAKERVLPSRRAKSVYGPDVTPAMTTALDAATDQITAYLVPWRERLDIGG